MSSVRKYFIRNFPSWLRSALNTTETDVPSSLFTQTDALGKFVPILPTIDSYQGGMGVAQLISGQDVPVTDPSLGTAHELIPIPRLPNVCYLVLAISLSPGAILAPFVVRLSMTNVATSFSGAFINLGGAQLTANTPTSWKDLTNEAQARIYIPPGYRPRIETLGMAANDPVTVSFAILQIPAGFKPF